jgi:Tfp pilus assembly protein PilN
MAKPAQANLQNLDINLIPTSENQGSVAVIVRWLLSVGRYLIIVTEIIALVIFGLSVKFTIDKNDLKESIDTKKAVIDTLSQDEELFRNYQQKVSQISTLIDTHSNTFSFYSDLLELLPSEAVFEEIKVENGKLTLSGSLPNPNSLQALISSLNSSEKFSELDITNLSVPTAQQPFYLFTASATLEPGVLLTGPAPVVSTAPTAPPSGGATQ